MQDKQATAFASTFHFFSTHNISAKKEHLSQHTKTRKLWTETTRQRINNEPLTTPTQKAEFRVSKTVLWVIKH
ncbi:MAG: hypothetical protein ACK5QU_03515 [Bacteroidota bacterium]|jgi:hypothetical protein